MIRFRLKINAILLTGLATLGTVAIAAPPRALPAAGAGTIVRQTGSDFTLIMASGSAGQVAINGIPFGEYKVSLPGKPGTITLNADSDAAIAYSVKRNGALRWLVAGNPANVTGNDNLPSLFAEVRPRPCDPLPGRVSACPVPIVGYNYIDVNRSTADQIVSLAPGTSPVAAAAIVAGRRVSPYRNLGDFARRVCTVASVNFGPANVLFQETHLIGRNVSASLTGFRCFKANTNVVLFGVAYPLTALTSWGI